jgi:hypothetical protein
LLRWVYWWLSTLSSPEEVPAEEVLIDLNKDFDTATMDAEEINALVSSWQAGAISHDTLLTGFRRGELIPPSRINEEELELIAANPPAAANVTLDPPA